MTALVGCRFVNLSLRLPKCGTRRNIQCRCFSSSQLVLQHASAEDKIVIPKRIKRSDTAILKELAKTVKQESGPHYKYHDDPYLLPYGVNKMTKHAMAKASGQKAAQHVIKTYPELFEFNPIDPMSEFPPGFKDTTVKEKKSLRKLKESITLRKPMNSYNLYEQLKNEGESIPEDVCEDLLGLLCATNGEITRETSDIVMFMDETDKVRFKLQGRASPQCTWRDDGPAELLFQQLEEPSPKAYNYLVRGRAKFGQKRNAKELFMKMRNERIPVSLETYNAVMTCPNLDDSGIQNTKKILQYMIEDGVFPNVHTFNNAVNIMVNWEESRRPTVVKKTVNEILNEMKSLKIEPNLTTWLQLLIVYYPGRYSNSDVIADILDELKDKKLTLTDDLDYEFFAAAMEVCFLKQDIELAYKLNDILNYGSNRKLLGKKSQEVKYQSNCIRLMSMFEQIDTVMEYYDRTYFMMFQGTFNTIIDLFKAIGLNDGHRYIPQLYTDLYQSEMSRKRNILEPLLDLMSKKQEEELQSEFAKIADKMKEEIEAVTDDSGRLQSMVYTGSMIGNLMQIYLNSNQFDSAWSCFTLFKRNQIKLEGYPKESCFNQLIGQCIDEKMNENVVESLTVMADGAYPSFEQLHTRALKELNLTASERKQMEDLD